MPATMMHLLAGKILMPEGSDAFYLGCILPDCLDGDRKKKDHLHLRDIAPQERLMGLIRLGKTLNPEKDFDLGALFHLYLDYLWDNGPQLAHRKAYEGDNWFRDYRKELKMAGSRSAQRAPWNKEVWERLYRAEPSLYESALSLPEEEVRSFLEYNYHWHLTEKLPESLVFTDEAVDSFTRHAIRAFRDFLRDFFPQVAKRHFGA